MARPRRRSESVPVETPDPISASEVIAPTTRDRADAAPLQAGDITPETAELPVPPPATDPTPAPPLPPRPRLHQIERVAAVEERVSLAMKALGAAKPAAGALVGQAASTAQSLVSVSRGAVRSATDRLFRSHPPREVDRFGRDPEFEQDVLRFFELLYRRYFRVAVRGIENVPRTGPALLVANHSGALPWDSAMLKTAVLLDHPAQRSIRPLSEDFVIHFPFLGVFLNRFGAVRACQENAEALLRDGELVAVFPEGTKPRRCCPG